jgi:hypothetical protein
MSAPLAGVSAYIEVYDSHGSLNSVLSDLMRSLGAEVSRRWKLSTTHVIWRKGNKLTFAKAIEHGQTLVTPQWVYACEQAGGLVDTADFRPPNPLLETSNKRKRTPTATSGKLRKLKSNQSSGLSMRTILREDPALVEHDLDLSKAQVLKLYALNLSAGQLLELSRAVSAVGCAVLVDSVLACHTVIVEKLADTLELAYAVSAGLPVVRVTWVKVCSLLHAWKDPRVFRLPFPKPVSSLFERKSFASEVEDSYRDALCSNIVRRLGGTWSSPHEADFLLSSTSPKYDLTWLISTVLSGVLKADMLT